MRGKEAALAASRSISGAGKPPLFFVAALPDGVEPDGGTTEARATEWIRADDAAQAGTLGRLGMLRPTLDVLSDLAAAADVDEVLATPRAIAPGGN